MASADSSDEGLHGALSHELPVLRQLARAAELEGRFPEEALEILRGRGILAAPLPCVDGGQGWGVDTNDSLLQALSCLGSASLVLGRIYEAHCNAIRLIACYGGPDLWAQTVKDVRDGHLFAIWVTPAAEPVRMLPDPDGHRIAGRKEFCSGAGFATRAVITARDPAGADRLVRVDAGQVLVEPGGTIRMHGMRSAHTNPVRFDLLVGGEAVIGEPGEYLRQPEFSAGAWRTLAVKVGGLEELVAETIRQLRARGRHADPHQSARIGRMLIASHTALMWAREAALAAETADAEAGEVTGRVNLARAAVETCCLDVSALVQRSLGLGALMTSNPIESMLRDLVTYIRQPAGDEALTEAACWFAENEASVRALEGRRRPANAGSS